MSFRPVAEFGHPPETGFLIQCRCLEVMGGHPDFLNAASRRLPNKGAEQIPRMTLSTMGLVNPHLPDLGCARPGVAHGSTNDATFAITHHETQCTAVIPTYDAMVALIETVLDRFCLKWRIVVTGLDACCHGTVQVSKILLAEKSSQARWPCPFFENTEATVGRSLDEGNASLEYMALPAGIEPAFAT
jgi:hypothetical protein